MMIPFYRYLEVGIFSILSFMPFLLLAMYPFRQQIRFSKRITAIMFLAVAVVQFYLCYLAAFFPVRAEVVSLLSTAVCAAFFFFICKDQIGRLSFVLLTLSTLGNLVAVCAKCMEHIFFTTTASEPFRWSLSLCMVIVHLLITLPIGFYIRKYLVDCIHTQTHCWRYLWMIPVTFYITWHYHLYITSENGLSMALSINHTVYMLLVHLITFIIIYYTVVLLLLEHQKNAHLAQNNHLLSLQTIQHEHLQQRINEARQAKHDVHHHILLIREYLRSGKLQELEAYLDDYSASLPETQSLIHCQHYATNILLSHFAQQAANRGIPMDIFVQLPEKINLPETTLSVVLGNLLENAIEASEKAAQSRRQITVRGKAGMGFVFFEITNFYEGDLRQNKHGSYLTTKSGHGHGLGLDSVAKLAASLGGILELNTDNNLFRVSVMLPEKKQD